MMQPEHKQCDLVETVGHIRECPKRIAHVRDVICGAVRSLALEEIARRRISNSIERK
jgi:hypothetical protein